MQNRCDAQRGFSPSPLRTHATVTSPASNRAKRASKTCSSTKLLAGALGGEVGALALPDPSAADAAAQWVSDLSQLDVFVMVIMAAGATNGEVRSGVASLLLVKPASCAAYVVRHAVVLVGFIAVTAFLGAFVSWGVTGVVFGGWWWRRFW